MSTFPEALWQDTKGHPLLAATLDKGTERYTNNKKSFLSKITITSLVT